MSIIRTDEQIDALELLKTVVKTAHFYRSMSEQATQQSVVQLLSEIAAERESYTGPLECEVRKLQELPAAPDADEEWVDELGGKIAQLFSADANGAVVNKCLEKDDALAAQVQHAQRGDQSAEMKQLLDALSAHLVATKERLGSVV